jgi:ribosomal protein L39E
MMEAARASETTAYSIVTTRRDIPEGSKIHTWRRENLKSRTEK